MYFLANIASCTVFILNVKCSLKTCRFVVCVCIYIYICIYMCVYIYVYICVYMCVCVCVCMHTHIYVFPVSFFLLSSILA